VTVKQSAAVGSWLAIGTATVWARTASTLIILFFLLASGDRLMRGFIEVLP
jgi:predicted PurR-regulated permease PerM